MRKRFWLALLILLTAVAPLSAQKRKDAIAQVDFGIKVAYKGLWKEAILRFEAAIKIDEKYAQAWNNLGIAYEQLGKFADARTAYETAMKLDPNNGFIKQNYEMFRDIYDRQNKRRGRF